MEIEGESVLKEGIETILQQNNPKSRECLKCGKVYIPKLRSKFCSIKCSTRYYSAKRYQRVKNDPTYKAYKKEYFRKWISNPKNKERFNELVRVNVKRFNDKKKAAKIMQIPGGLDGNTK